MPRDGSGNYTLPYSPVVDGTTVESAVHNGTMSDIALQLNGPVPIIAGGTGANNAHSALINLKGEEAGQLVTNYDTHPFVDGSFYSAPGATSAPNAGSYFVGICYGVVAGAPILEVSDVSDGLSPHTRHSRTKLAAVWQAWVQQPGSLASLEGSFVNQAGDTMTGPLIAQVKGHTLGAAGGTAATGIVTPADASIRLYHGSATNWGGIGVDSSGHMWFKTGISGTPVPAFWLNGSNQGASFVSNLTAGGVITSALTATTGTFNFGTAGGKFLTCDGSNFNLTGGLLVINSSGVVSGYNGGTGTTGAYYFGSTGSKYLLYDGTDYSFTGGALATVTNRIGNAGAFAAVSVPLRISYTGGVTQYGMSLRPTVDTTTAIYFEAAGGSYVGGITVSPTTTAYGTSSSGELKEDLKSFDAGNIIDDTKVYDFKWKSSEERAYGVIAQQAAEVYPLAVTHMQQEGSDQDFWSVDYSKYVPVLLQELKALRARVAALEGGTAAKPS